MEPALIARARDDVDRFETLIRRSAGDRATFDGIISELLPEAREQYQNRVKQILYRGFSHLKGYSVDVDFTAVFIHPSPDESCLDYGVICGVLGLRRLRPNARVRLEAMVVGKEPTLWQSTTLDGKPLEDATSGRLDQFCTAPVAEVQVEQIGGSLSTVLTSAAMGPHAAVNLVLGHRNRLAAPRYSDPGKRTLSGAGVEVDKPAKLLHFDVFVHGTLYGIAPPELIMLDTAFRGMGNMNDASRLQDRLEVTERIEPLGRGFGSVRASHIQRYSEMLEYVVDTCGWDAQAFRGYRCLIAHPIYGTQITLGFQLPERAY